MRCHVIERWQLLVQNGTGCDHDAMTQGRQLGKHCKALRDNVLVRRKAVPCERFPLNKMPDRNIVAKKEACLGFELVGVTRVFREQEEGSLLLRGQKVCQFSGGERCTRANQAPPGGFLPRRGKRQPVGIQ